jgi:hypothetical protein
MKWDFLTSEDNIRCWSTTTSTFVNSQTLNGISPIYCYRILPRFPPLYAQDKKSTSFTMNVDTDMTGHSLRVSLDALPDEVLQHILYYLSPQEMLLNIQRLSHRFNTLGGEPLLWRYHCRMQFIYWDSKHRIRQKLSGNVGDVDWKLLYIHRRKIDSRTTEILDSILEGQTNRIEKFKMIGEFGYDAKDTLLKHCHTSADAEDALARR